jgi:microcin C transport system substrate-binding protein
MLRALLLVGLLFTWAAPSQSVDLDALDWKTNSDEPIIGSPDAKPGGTFHTWISAYPLTFRIVGPDSNDQFAGWNRSQTTDFTLVWKHPTTDAYIPCLATHWAIEDDHQTLYFRLDPDARWSDNTPITADDFVFALEMLKDENIVDPFWNNYVRETYQSVTALDKYTLMIVGAQPSWRPLYDFNLFPLPRHIHDLDETWVKRHNREPSVGVGPYVIGEMVEGQTITFEKINDWWGKEKRTFQGLYNVDEIKIAVIPDIDRAFDHFQKGELDFYRVTSAKKWATGTDIEAIRQGWVHKRRTFVDVPDGIHGLALNLERPKFQNKDFRKAIQYAFDFDDLNENLMFGAYYRKVSAFEGTEYENPSLRPYGFNPKKCREHLSRAGYSRRGDDGFFVNEAGEKASFSLIYGSPAWSAFLTIMKQRYQTLGIEIELTLLEAGTAFKRGLDRNYDTVHTSRASSTYPAPYQYFHTDFLSTRNNNNVWAFGSAHTDELIETYRFDMDKDARIAAMHELDAIIQDEAFYVPFFQAPYVRFVYWDHVQFPEFYFPKRFEQMENWQVFWIDEEKREAVEAAVAAGQAYPPDSVVDVDPYGIKLAVEAAMAGAGAEQ